MTEIINNNLDECTFPETLKLADVYPVFKKEDRTIAEYYRPVNIFKIRIKDI